MNKYNHYIKIITEKNTHIQKRTQTTRLNNNFTTFFTRTHCILALINRTKCTMCGSACVCVFLNGFPMFHLKCKFCNWKSLVSASIQFQYIFICLLMFFFRSPKYDGIELVKRFEWYQQQQKMKSTQSKGIFNWWKETITSDNNIELYTLYSVSRITFRCWLKLEKKNSNNNSNDNTKRKKRRKKNENENEWSWNDDGGKSARSGKPINPTEQFAKKNTFKSMDWRREEDVETEWAHQMRSNGSGK